MNINTADTTIDGFMLPSRRIVVVRNTVVTYVDLSLRIGWVSFQFRSIDIVMQVKSNKKIVLLRLFGFIFIFASSS